MPFVSLIVPVYNADKHINKCLVSFFNQSYKDFEVIFVNDGSNDNSKTILETYLGCGLEMKIIDKENGGQGSARNLGLQYARGEFVCFVDIDDYISDEMLSKLINCQKETNADIVWCDAYLEKEDIIIGKLDENTIVTDHVIKQYMMNNAGPCRKLIRKELLIKNNLYFPHIRFYEDIAVVPAYGLYAKKIVYINEPLYYYIQHEGSTMHQKNYDIRLECIFESLEILRKQFINSGKYDVYKDELEYLYITHLLHAASLRFFSFKEDGKNSLIRISEVMKMDFPNWRKNKYYVKKDWKDKLICELFYRKKYFILKILLN